MVWVQKERRHTLSLSLFRLDVRDDTFKKTLIRGLYKREEKKDTTPTPKKKKSDPTTTKNESKRSRGPFFFFG